MNAISEHVSKTATATKLNLVKRTRIQTCSMRLQQKIRNVLGNEASTDHRVNEKNLSENEDGVFAELEKIDLQIINVMTGPSQFVSKILEKLQYYVRTALRKKTNSFSLLYSFNVFKFC